MWLPLEINKLIHESSQSPQLEIPRPPSFLDGKDCYICPISVLVPPLSITSEVNEASSFRIWFPFVMSKGSNLYTSHLKLSLTSGYNIKLFSWDLSVLGMVITFVDDSFGNLWGLAFIPAWYFQSLKEYSETYWSHICQASCEVPGRTTN